MEHDPLCPQAGWRVGGPACQCALIARTRSHDRMQVAQAWQMGGWTVLTKKIRSIGGEAPDVLGIGQMVADWLRSLPVDSERD